MSKTDTILEHVSDIRVNVGKIEQHLVDLNGTVARHEESISFLKKFCYRTGGGIAALVFFWQVLEHFL